MKIIGLSLKNVRLIEALDLKISDKGLTQVVGKNKQGKTTILDSIMLLLTGFKKEYADIIKEGKEEAEMSTIIDDYTIVRKIKNGKSTLKITDNEGHQVAKTKEFLDDIINNLTFNPKDFMDKNPRQKLKFLLDFYNINFDEINARIEEHESKRKAIGRHGKSLGKIIPVHEKLEKVSLVDLLKERDEIQKENNRRGADKGMITHTKSVMQTIKNDIASDKEEIESLKRTINALESDIIENNSKLKTLEKQLEEYLEKDLTIIPVDDINLKIYNAEEYNEQVVEQERVLKNNDKIRELKAEYKEQDAIIEQLRAEKLEMLANVDTGIEGLKITEEDVFYNDYSSSNWSTSEAMRISLELCHMMKPTLRAIFYDRGEAFDIDSLKELHKWGVENDMQIIITRVGTDTYKADFDHSFYIQEGELINE